MSCVAVFVDAGYLFAQGSVSLSGSNAPRSQLRLNNSAVVAELKKIAQEKGDGCRLLRIYWYDGTSTGRLSIDQASLANSDDIKLRLGQINSAGEQKGVDSFIVTDLIELARNRAISDALLLSGDEDIRIGVQIAQSFGVRVHLLGIEANKHSQSPLLLQEADTTSLWNKTDVGQFLSIKAPPPAAPKASSPATGTAAMAAICDEMAASLDNEQLAAFSEYRKSNKGVPPEYDRKLIAKARDEIGRDLEQRERWELRAAFVDAVKKRSSPLP